jgi:RNA polymerase sigma factor (TIGR02999 family)
VSRDVSAILAAGDLDALMPVVYDELRGLAAAQLKRERAGHSLQPTALANEAYFKLVDTAKAGMQGRAHFFGVAARAMRQVLVEHARKKQAAKRGGDLQRVTLSIADAAGTEPLFDILDLEDALQELAKLDERKARVLELRFFAGLTMVEAATVLDVSPKTVEADWYMARAWLKTRLG